MATFLPVFLLLVAWSQAVPAHVEPPTNVTLNCRNLHNVVKWSYGEFLPGLKFKVFVGSTSSPPKKIWVDPPNLQADVSFSSDPTNDYFLTVKAVIGQNESVDVPSDEIVFSYFKSSPANQKCSLDFPAMNVTAQQDGPIMFSFTHPWLLYNYKLTSGRVKKRDNAQRSEPIPEFQFNVAIDGQEKQMFFCDQRVCEDKYILVDPAQKKYCLKAKGEMDGMAVEATRLYCAEPTNAPPKDKGYVFIFIGVALLALLAFAFIFYMVYRKKTKPSSSFPNSMTFSGRVRQWALRLPEDQVIVPDVEPPSPTPLLSTPEDTPTATSPAQYELRLPIGQVEGVSTMDEGVCEDIEVGNHEESFYMHGKNMEEDEPELSDPAPSGYEKRQVIVDLAPGENAEGYRG
ncbi:growth/differentiation factor 10b [Pagrus major]|uniref:growth/differentiation factor 10b n=1 Tax=Pagrus major TaxID=143350 RepID=UPI003CC84F8E